MPSSMDKPKGRGVRRWDVWLTLSLCLTVSLVLFWLAHQRIREESYENFAHAAHEVAELLDQELEHHLNTLDAMTRITQSRHGNWRWHSWKQMAEPMFEPSFAVGQQMILYVRRIADHRIEETQSEYQRQGLTHWRVHPRLERLWHDVVVYQIDDGSAGQSLWGLDLQISAQCRQAMNQSTDLGQPVLSSPIRMPMHEELNGRLAFFSPVYAAATTPDTVVQRRGEVIGWVVSLIDMPTFLKSVAASTDYRLTLSLQDQQQDDSAILASMATAGQIEPDMVYPIDRRIMNHDWKLVFGARRSDYDEIPQLPWLVLGVGLGFTALVTGLAWALGHQRLRAERLNRKIVRAHQQQESQGQKLAILVKSSCRGIALLDQAGRIQWANASLTRLFDLSETAMQGRHLLSLMAGVLRHESSLAMLQQKLAGGQEYRAEFEWMGTGGRTLQVELDLHPVVDPQAHSPQEFIATFNDLTVRRQVDRESDRREKLQQELEDMRSGMKAMEQVLAVVSHELRTPLAGIRAITELMLTDMPEDVPSGKQEDQHGFIQQIHDSVSGMSQTITNILEAARINSGRTQWNWDAVDPALMVDSVVQQIQLLVTGHAVGLRRKVAPNLPMIQGDAQALQRLLLNLAANAVRFTQEGWIEIRAGLVECQGRQMLELAVEDTGQGMTDETLSKLGQPFALASGSVGGDLASGTGLGLSICRAIASAHGGHIVFKSELGIGTCAQARIRMDLKAPMQDETGQGGEIITQGKDAQPIRPSVGQAVMLDEEPNGGTRS